MLTIGSITTERVHNDLLLQICLGDLENLGFERGEFFFRQSYSMMLTDVSINKYNSNRFSIGFMIASDWMCAVILNSVSSSVGRL